MTSLEYIDQNTPMGCKVVNGGATFRVWAPRASTVYVSGDFNGWNQNDQSKLNDIGGGYWAGFVPNAGEGDTYKYYVVGPGGQGYKRDPYAPELTAQPAFPFCNCVITSNRFPWHDDGYHPPAFNDLIIYQFHVGTFSIKGGSFGGKFLDVMEKIPYLVALGVNAIQPLPIVEFPTEFSLGYNGTDYFSPEEDYGVTDLNQLNSYLLSLNNLLSEKGQPPYTLNDIRNTGNQLRALVDICHLYGLAVLFDVVYNHAGGGFDQESLYFFDQMQRGDNNQSLYFTNQGWAGGLVFAYWNRDVRQFLINNALFFLQEFHIDGYRYDEVSVMDRYGGWYFCRELTDTCRFMKPSAIHIAEYWPVNNYVVKSTHDGGAGFDSTWHNGLRESVRDAISQAATGSNGFVDMERIASTLRNLGVDPPWRAVQCIEDHDIVKRGEKQRIAGLADGSNNKRSWYARSRARAASGLLLTAPGIPMIFMGQEFLEDKQWSDDPRSGNLIWWQGLQDGDKSMVDHLRFTQDLINLRKRHPALRSSAGNVFHVHNSTRILAFHRWIEGVGRDVVVVISLNESTLWNYELGFPVSGRWLEAFNSDVYDNWVNPWAAGNRGAADASGPPNHGLPASASVVVPANSVVVFTRDTGD